MKSFLVFTDNHKWHMPSREWKDGVVKGYLDIPERIGCIMSRMEKLGVFTLLEVEKPITISEITETHDTDMVRFLETADEHIECGSYVYADTFPTRSSMYVASSFRSKYGFYCFDSFSPLGCGTWRACLASATVAAYGASCLLSQESTFAYALTRPPGHHAGPDFFGGYCYLNNAAIAARRLFARGRVAIVDIDYHHGNGTQAIFWDEPEVFYGSIHVSPVFEYPFYSGFSDEVGGKKAKGTNWNIPLPPGTSGADYILAVEQLLDKVVDFAPKSLVVSVGFDAYVSDPLSSFGLCFEDYEQIGIRLAALNLPTLFVQEGGYDVAELPRLADALVSGFLGYSAEGD